MHFGLDGGVNDRDDTVDLAVDGDIDGEYTEALKRMESPTLDLHHVPLQPTKRKPLKQQKYSPPAPLVPSPTAFPISWLLSSYFGFDVNVCIGCQHMESPYHRYHKTSSAI